jgi:hypothetical protein
MMKKNKACIPPIFLEKADEGTVQYAFDHANNFALLSVTPKRNKRFVFQSTMHSEIKRQGYWKRRNKCFTTKEKVIWKVMIKCASCTQRQGKQTVSQ